MSEKILTNDELRDLHEKAEWGELDHSTASKRHVRIMASLHFILGSNEEDYSVPYASMETILKIIECFFGKKYQPKQLLYWIDDLLKKGYLAVYDEDEVDDLEKNFFSLTETGIALFVSIFETRDTLFESNSRNSLAFLN